MSQAIDWLDKNGIPYWDLCFMKAIEASTPGDASDAEEPDCVPGADPRCRLCCQPQRTAGRSEPGRRGGCVFHGVFRRIEDPIGSQDGDQMLEGGGVVEAAHRGEHVALEGCLYYRQLGPRPVSEAVVNAPGLERDDLSHMSQHNLQPGGGDFQPGANLPRRFCLIRR